MNLDIAHVFILLTIIVITMVLHEIAHAYVSHWLGDDTARSQGRLSLNPIKHLDPFMSVLLPLLLALSGAPIFGGAKPVQYNPNNVKWGDWGVMLVALAGPLTNLIIAFVAFGSLVMINPAATSLIGDIIFQIIGVNLGLFIFNLIPIPPLDGSRALYALAPDFVRKFMESVEPYGMYVVFALVIFASSWLMSLIVQAESFILHIFQIIFMVN